MTTAEKPPRRVFAAASKQYAKDAATIREGLAREGERLSELRTDHSDAGTVEREYAREHIRDLYVRARDHGMTVVEVAELVGMTRQGLHLVLRGNTAREYRPPKRDALLVALTHEQRDALVRLVGAKKTSALRGAVTALQTAREVEWRTARSAGMPRKKRPTEVSAEDDAPTPADT